ncbi:winged helix DNA-binding domain-containing protein [Amycolatopsis tucumanensis]|nr:winged helix DNA-binding domain-containing protein [Amycolatopsis tucumanensis]MCF6425289.1 winged helix DNA-binding domain-containing protein [Amycolatopsis tucumanensis]
MTDRVSWTAVQARRLDRHFLSRPAASPADAVAAMCGAHAQVRTAAEVSVALRTGGTADDVRDAVADHTLIRTFGPRGTVHLLPARDLALWTGALPAVPQRSTMPSAVRLTDEQTDRIVEAVADALADAELTADELTGAVVDRVGPWAGDLVMPAFQGFWPRWRQALATAAHRGALCFGRDRGRQVTYTSPRRWLPGFRPEETEPALTGVLARYLHAYGPATPQHFARWLSAPVEWASALFARAGLRPVDLDGERMWLNADDTLPGRRTAPALRLLPLFDAHVVGSFPRELLFPGAAAHRCLARGQAGNFPVLLVNGVAGGVWHQRRSGRAVHLTVEPFTTLSAAHRRELDEQVTRLGEVLGREPRLTIGPVTVGAHA